MFEFLITERVQHQKIAIYLKGLSVVPSSEGFTMTAFLPAYLQEIQTENQEIQICYVALPAGQEQDDLPAFHDFPHFESYQLLKGAKGYIPFVCCSLFTIQQTQQHQLIFPSWS